MPTKDRIIRFHAALSGAKMIKFKSDLLSGYGVESTKELTDNQCDELVDRLNQMQTTRKEASPQVRVKRSVILSLLSKMGVFTDGLDWSAVNRYLLLPQISGKLLYEHDMKELDALHRKLRVIAKKNNDAQQEDNYLARNN